MKLAFASPMKIVVPLVLLAVVVLTVLLVASGLTNKQGSLTCKVAESEGGRVKSVSAITEPSKAVSGQSRLVKRSLNVEASILLDDAGGFDTLLLLDLASGITVSSKFNDAMKVNNVRLFDIYKGLDAEIICD